MKLYEAIAIKLYNTVVKFSKITCILFYSKVTIYNTKVFYKLIYRDNYYYDFK